jgi:hypothetical protein
MMHLANAATATVPASKSATFTMSQPSLLLRLEGLVFFAAAIAAYASQGFSGVAFALLLLVPDVSMLGYLAGPRIGSTAYNAAHHYLAPIVLIGLGIAGAAPVAIQVGLIWFAHISMDRVVGYGFKYASAFKDTHMQRV